MTQGSQTIAGIWKDNMFMGEDPAAKKLMRSKILEETYDST
jgi:hypothetical protein